MSVDNVWAVTVPAVGEQLDAALDFVEKTLAETNVAVKLRTPFMVATDEIFTNIAYYAYPDGPGTVELSFDINPDCVSLTFADSGLQHDPLAHPDPDVTLSADERDVGGLGIYLVKSLMDDVTYAYTDGMNRLTLKKQIPAPEPAVAREVVAGGVAR